MSRLKTWILCSLLVPLVTSGLSFAPARATVASCGGLYMSSASCTLPRGVTQYAIEIAGGSGGDGEGTTNGSPGLGVGGYGALEVINATKEIEQKIVFIGVASRGQDGKNALFRQELNGGTALAGSSGGYGWLSRRDSESGRGSGSGGGASDLRTQQDNPATRFLVAGGGGGGGASSNILNGGKGGHANQNGGGGADSSNSWYPNSNPLGVGENGKVCTGTFMDIEAGGGGGGGAGTLQNSGGGGGAGCANNGTPGTGGSLGQSGGTVSNNGYSWLGGLSSLAGTGANAPLDEVGFAGGGGGGGYFGGGSGGTGGVAIGGDGGGGGGGGGSSLIPDGATLISSGWNTGNGFAQISTISSLIPESNYTVGQNFSHQITVSGFKKGTADTSLPVTYSISGAPAGITISSSSGAISGSLNEAGSFSLQVTASAEWSAGNTISSIQKFTLNVAKIEQVSNLPIKLTMKKRSAIAFTLSQLKTVQNQDIQLNVQGACKISQTYKNVKTKVGKKTKYVKTLSGYKITMGKKARQTCTVIEAADPTTSLNAFSKSTVISIK